VVEFKEASKTDEFEQMSVMTFYSFKRYHICPPNHISFSSRLPPSSFRLRDRTGSAVVRSGSILLSLIICRTAATSSGDRAPAEVRGGFIIPNFGGNREIFEER
jgi:hypothetical protein